MAKKSMAEKVVDIFVSTIARDISKTAVKRAKELFVSKTSRKKLQRTTDDIEPDASVQD
mgnify:CR=1 FL=1